jgi:hypothetical protein
MKVVARETFPYAGIVRRPGETFDAESAEDARVLRLAGLIDSPEKTTAPPPAHDDEADALPAAAAPPRRRPRKQHEDEAPVLAPVPE